MPMPGTSMRTTRRVHGDNETHVDVLGPVRVLHVFLPLLERSAAPVVVNVSSGLGSIASSADPESAYSALVVPAYPSSKAALNMLTTQYAKAFPRIRINSVDPGFTGTDLNQNPGYSDCARRHRHHRADGDHRP